jgi:threonine-phosphate decarboxylase
MVLPVKRLLTVMLCAKIPWNVNCLAQAAAVAALKDEEHLKLTHDLIKKEKAWLQQELSQFGGFQFRFS